jgi:tetratricopeptide (TPR) repeat protein
MSSGIANVAKAVLREAVKFGLDEAGSRVCGQTAWNAVKKVLAPVFGELERRYPKMFLVDEEMEKAQADLSSDPLLAEQIRDHLAGLKEGHAEIMQLLVRFDDKLASYRDLIVRAVQEADRKNQARHESIISEITSVKTVIDDLGEQIQQAPVQPHLSLGDIYKQANGYQMDAMKWIAGNDGEAASQRLATARTMAISGLKQDPNSARMMVTLGFTEKTQAQVSELRGDPESSTRELSLAAQYFAKAIELDKTDVNAIHGMANVYYFGRDYDTAIQLELAVVTAWPNHGPALNDLALALEAKLRQGGPKESVQATKKLLVKVYQMLERVMPQQPQIFPASYLAYVQKRLRQLNSPTGPT